MKTTVKICSFALVLMSAIVLLAQASKWPVIRSLEAKRVYINPGKESSDTPFVALIRDSGGVPTYKLECHNGNYDDELEINFSGDFQCALFAVKGKTLVSGNLLAANTKNEMSTDWWNRGRMRSAQLRGECLKYPEYSTARHFKLRGMLLTLSFTDVGWGSAKDQQNNPVIGKFTFTANAVPDPTAKSSRADEVEGPAPPTSCYP
jgi:hypothetical protein